MSFIGGVMPHRVLQRGISLSLARTSILFFCFLTLVSIHSAQAAQVDWGLERRWPIIASQDQLWIGTEAGLYRYDVSEDAWLVFTSQQGLCGQAPEILGLDEGILWVATSQGLCNADIHLFDWDYFDTTRGLPSNSILSLDFGEDYVWIGTQSGVVRFDLLSQELESFRDENAPAAVKVNDIAVEGETVWLATEDGVWEFSIEYETWRIHTEAQGLPSRWVWRIMTAAGGGLWFHTDAGLARFDAASRTWFSYEIPGLTRINDLDLDGSAIWLATDGGVFFYDQALDQWREFQELQSLGLQKVNGITIAQDEIWLATEEGVFRFDVSTKTWTTYTVDNGLSSNHVRSIDFWNQILFVTSPAAIDYYKVTEDRWYSQQVETLGAAEDTQRRPVITLGGVEGTVFRPSSQVTMRLLGRASYQYERRDEDVLSPDRAAYTSETQGRTNLALVSNLTGGRVASAFYDDTKFDRQREYGLRYRGAEADLLQEASLGDMRWNLGRGDLLPTLGLFGGGTRLEAGARTSRLRRRRLAIAVGGGDQTTDFQTDFFVGGSHSCTGILADRQYLKRRFFQLLEESEAPFIRSGSVSIYMDDGLEATNTLNTRADWHVAGLMGDFDLLHPVEDYALDSATGMLDVYRTLSDIAVLVAIFELGEPHGGRREVVLYGDGFDASVVNRYFLGATEILPQTLSLAILDTLGVRQPLGDFGLDSDGDGAMDAQFVDFYHGILCFPTARPFPDPVYLPEDPQHLFILKFSFQTSSTAFQLSRGDLVSESERVVVDGQLLRRGEDYILDYRSGSLVFLREGLVESNSRVEVEYEYHRESEDQLMSLGASFSPSDLLSVGINAARYSPQNGDVGGGSVDLLQTTGELRWDQGPAGMDFLLLGEAAQSASSESQGSAARLRSSAKNNRLRLLAEVEDYEENFLSLRPRRTVLGQLLRRTRAEARYEQSNLFVLDAGWASERSLDHLGRSADEQRYQTRGILNRKGYPTVVIAAVRRLSGGFSPFPDQTSLRGDLEYQVPSGLASAMRLHALKMTAYVHRRWDDGVDSTYNPASRKAIQQGEYVRLDVAPLTSFRMVGSLRRDSRRAKPLGAKGDYRFAGEIGEAIVTTNCDAIPGLSVYARLEGDAREDPLSGGESSRAYSLDRQRQVITRVYPGFWQRIFTPITLEISYAHRWKGQLEGVKRQLNPWKRYWSTFSGEEVVAGEEFHSRGLRGEIRPSGQLILNLGLEWQERDHRQLSSLLQDRLWKYISKVELRRASSVLVLNFLRDEWEKIGISTRVKNAPSLWWERRWSVGFITKASLFSWWESMREGKLEETSKALSPRLGITSRWPKFGLLGAVELTDDFSVTLSQRSESGLDISTLVMANALKLDIRPLPLSLIRLQSQLTYTDNEKSADILNHELFLRLTLQF